MGQLATLFARIQDVQPSLGRGKTQVDAEFRVMMTRLATTRILALLRKHGHEAEGVRLVAENTTDSDGDFSVVSDIFVTCEGREEEVEDFAVALGLHDVLIETGLLGAEGYIPSESVPSVFRDEDRLDTEAGDRWLRGRVRQISSYLDRVEELGNA